MSLRQELSADSGSVKLDGGTWGLSSMKVSNALTTPVYWNIPERCCEHRSSAMLK